MKKDSVFFRNLVRERKQRRSRCGLRWKMFLGSILDGIIARVWDLDILLDPFFLQFTRTGEKRMWYPGVDCSSAPQSLEEALEFVDRVGP